MGKINKMLEYLGVLYNGIQQENVSEEEMQILVDEFTLLFRETGEEEGYDYHEKNDLGKVFEKNAEKKLKALEEKIKNKDKLSVIPEQAKSLIDIIEEFWKETGFRYIEKVEITKHGSMEMDLGFMIESDEIEKIKEKGYILHGDDLADCDTNMKKLTQLFNDRFPSAVLTEKKTYTSLESDGHDIRSISVLINDVKDIVEMKKEPV